MRRPTAQLTGALLARKGQARPATAGGALPQSTLPLLSRAPDHDAARRLGAPFLLPDAPGALAAAGGAGRVALTLRLDPVRHRRLKILAARRRQSSHEILLEALDALLATCGADCRCMAGDPGGCGRN